MDVIAAVAALVCCMPDGLDVPEVSALLGRVAEVRGWLDGVEAQLGDRLDRLRTTAGGAHGDGAGPSAPAAPVAGTADQIAAAQRSTSRHAQRIRRRGRTLGELPALADALDAGVATGEHVDAVRGALAGLPEAQRRQVLAAHADEIVALARNHDPDALARQVRRLGDAAAREAGVSRRTRQRRDTRLRTWVDRDSQMIRLNGTYDPASGIRLQQRLGRAVDHLFHERRPDDCPEDPTERQDFLRAHALLHLVLRDRGSDGDTGDGYGGGPSGSGPSGSGGCGGGGGHGGGGHDSSRRAAPRRTDLGGGEIIVIVDERTLLDGLEHDDTHVDVPGGVDPHEITVDDIRGWADDPGTRIVPAVLDADGVVRALGRPIPAPDAFERGDPEAGAGAAWRWRAERLAASLARPRRLDRGRSVRVADHAQRTALRIMHPTCIVLGCTVRFEHTNPHHIRWWERDHGPTDLWNLGPLCDQHHHDVHDRGWRLVLSSDRRPTIRLPGAPARHGEEPAAFHRRLRAERAAWRATHPPRVESHDRDEPP